MNWAEHGVKIVHSNELDLNTPQTWGMTRAAAITHARAGANKLWAGTMLVQPGGLRSCSCEGRTGSDCCQFRPAYSRTRQCGASRHAVSPRSLRIIGDSLVCTA